MFDGFAVCTVFYSIWHKNKLYFLSVSFPSILQKRIAILTPDSVGWKAVGLLREPLPQRLPHEDGCVPHLKRTTTPPTLIHPIDSLSCWVLRGKDRRASPGSYYSCQATGVDCRCRAALLLKKAILRSALSACWPPVLRDKGGGMSRQ